MRVLCGFGEEINDNNISGNCSSFVHSTILLTLTKRSKSRIIKKKQMRKYVRLIINQMRLSGEKGAVIIRHFMNL